MSVMWNSQNILFCASYNPPLKKLLENNTYNPKSKWEQTHVTSLALKTKLIKDIVERERQCSSHAGLETQTLESADLGSVHDCAWFLSSGQAGVGAVLQASNGRNGVWVGFLGVFPVFLCHKFHYTISSHTSNSFSFISFYMLLWWCV